MPTWVAWACCCSSQFFSAKLPVLMVLGVLGYAWLRVRVWFQRARQPNGTLDGRRNVHVREVDDVTQE